MAKPSFAPKDSHVFDAKAARVEEGAGKKIHEDVGSTFDAHDLTVKIIEFGKVLTGMPLYDYQYAPAYRIIYSVVCVEGSVLTLIFSRQSGKTEVVAFVADTLAVILPALVPFYPELDQYKDGIKIGLFAPQSDQVTTTYTRAMSRLTSENADMVLSDPDIDVELTSTVRLSLTNGSYLKGQVASKMSKIESKTYDLVFCEEAQDLDDFLVQKSIEPMVSATNGTIVKVGTTGTQKGNFWYEIQNNIRQDRALTDTRLKTHYEYDYKSVIQSKRAQFLKDGRKFHLNYEKDVLKKRERWGEDADAFRLGYALVWALDSGMFITDKDWERIIDRRRGFAKEVRQDELIVAGLDIAKTQDRTVLTIGRVKDSPDPLLPPIKEVIAWVSMQGDDYEDQHRKILDAIAEWDIQILFGDYTGVGRPVIDRLAHACGDLVQIMPYTFSRPSKSDMWLALQEDIRGGRVSVPANRSARSDEDYKRFEQQMRNLLKWYQGSYLVAEAPAGDHDDYCDSLALMILAGNVPISSDEFEVMDNVLFSGAVNARNAIANSSW